MKATYAFSQLMAEGPSDSCDALRGYSGMKLMRLVSLAILVASMSCGDATGPAGQITDLETARQRWQAQDLHTYAFTLERSCFCPSGKFHVLVVKDTVSGVLDIQTGATVDSHVAETIEDLFTFVQKAIDGNARKIRVEYDDERGFPTVIDYDESTDPDDEILFHISDVHPVTPPT